MTRIIGRNLPGPVSIQGDSAATATSAAWAEITGDGFDELPNGAQSTAVINSIDHQSGGFTQIDDYTIGLPQGIFTVDWVFSVAWQVAVPIWFANPGDYLHTKWLMWKGGVSPTSTVGEQSVFDKSMLETFHFFNISGDPYFRTGQHSNSVQWHHRITVRAGNPDPNENRLQLAVLSIEWIFGDHVPDFETGDHFLFQSGSGFGESTVRIHGSTAADIVE